MNILFVNFHEPAVNSGGIETITGILSTEFQQEYSANVYCLWKLPCKDSNDAFNFTESKSLPGNIEQIASLLISWEIDFIIVQAYNDAVPLMKMAIGLSQRNVKLIYVLHSTPGWERCVVNWQRVKEMPKTQGLRGWLKVFTYPLFRYLYTKKLEHTYRSIYSAADCVVLLSPSYINQFVQEYKLSDSSKFKAVPNCNPIDITETKSSTTDKEKIVLIVSRLAEYQKNLFDALKIWNIIEKTGELAEWKLVIVGDGPDRPMYENYIKSEHLQRVEMVGQRSPLDYYKESAIFMMTSKFEGFPMTLLEIQNFGCVPIVYNSFGSASDIIKNKKNGILIDYGNINQYVDALKSLMQDTDKRNIMSKNAQEEVKKFSRENIAKMWVALFSEL